MKIISTVVKSITPLGLVSWFASCEIDVSGLWFQLLLDVSGAEVCGLSDSYYNRCGVDGRGLSSGFPMQPPCQA